MKKIISFVFAISTVVFISCNSQSETSNDAVAENTEAPGAGQSGVQDEVSNPNIVQVAVSSKDHTTLVAAVKAAGLVDALSNAGPFTVFAPTNASFDKLPAGTVDGLLKPEKLEDLKGILEYHTYVGVLKTEYFDDGQEYEMVNGSKIKITMVDGKPVVNGKAHIVASIPTSNGIIHVLDEVLLPG
jgi:uncharacterized surface protein with fasciclin (FAS1) repeats